MTLENKHVFARPVEVIASTSITFPAPTNAVTVTAGVYANVYTLATSINNQVGANVEVLVSENGYIGIYLSAGGDITFGSLRIRNDLGYSENVTGAGAGSVSVSNFRPPSVWISEHQVGNQGHWVPKLTDRFAGTTAGDGTLAGNVRGPRIYHRKFSFPHESAPNVAQELATTLGEWASLGFERWAEMSMTAYPDENNVPMRGFFWFVDFYETVQQNIDRTVSSVDYTSYFDSTYIADKNALIDISSTGTMDELELQPLAMTATYYEYYLFCMLPHRGVAFANDASVPAGRGYYTVDFDCHTAGQPTNGWTFTT